MILFIFEGKKCEPRLFETYVLITVIFILYIQS